MRVLFRVDASLVMGSGHVMRCLTLARALRERGHHCLFVSREHPGHLNAYVQDQGFELYSLPMGRSQDRDLYHAHWLGASQEEDALACRPAIETFQPDWLIVDHYALDARWEKALRPYYRELMVIDDLADRPHQCDLLLDQTFARSKDDYKPWVATGCTVLCGSQYALLRPDFIALRQYSLDRRENLKLEHLLISMGGVDKDNATGMVLDALKNCVLPANCCITVVMGVSSPWLAEVRQQAEQLPWPTAVRVNVSDMAQLMADSDLAIGAAGSTSWERCCLGLPTVLVVLADNQQQVAQGLKQAGAVDVLQGSQQIAEHLPRVLAALVSSSAHRAAMSQAARCIADGNGVATVIQHLES